MIVYGVSKSGKDVRVNDDFSIHIPYGYCYDIGNKDAGDETALFLAKPAWQPAGYTSGAFSISDDTECDLTLSLKATHEVTVAPDAEELGIDFDQMLKELSKNADNHTMSMDVSLNGVSASTETFGEGSFRRAHRMVVDEPFLKAGYFTLGILGRTAYSVVILTRHHMYSATTIPPAQDHPSVERELADLLSSISDLEEDAYNTAKASGTEERSAVKEQSPTVPDRYKGKNGKLDAFQVAEWFCRDVLFSNDGDFPFDGKHHTMKGLQMNAASPQIAEIAPIMDVLQPEIEQAFRFVEQNEDLMISKNSFHKEILRATRGEPITGLTVFDLCAWHMLMLMRNSDNDYTAFVDRNLVKGIPDAYAFVGEFIRTLRHYNGQKENFCVHFNLVNNMDSPCGEIDTPVSGAVCKAINEITFHGDSAASDVKLPTAAQGQKQTSVQIRDMEDTLDANLCAALKQEAATAKKKLDAYARAIRNSSFSSLHSMDSVLNRLKSLSENNSELKGLGFEINYIQRRFSVTHSPESIHVDGDYFICGVSAGFSSEPKDLAENLAGKIDAVTAEELYLSLLKQADEMWGAGKTIHTPGGGTIKCGEASKTTTPTPTTVRRSNAGTVVSTGQAKSTSNDLRRFVQVVECANPQSWTEQKPGAAEQKHIASTVHAEPTSNDLRRFVQVVECADPQSWTEQKLDAMKQMRKELAALEEATSAVTKKREAEKNKRFSALDDDLKKKLELLDKSYEDAGTEIARQIDAAKQQIAELSNNRSSLKWFDFSEKNRLKKETAAIEQRIAELERNQADNEKQHAADVRKAKSANTRKKTKIGREIELQYPMPQDAPEAIKARAERRLRRGRHS